MPLPPQTFAAQEHHEPEKPVRRLKLIIKTRDPSFTGGGEAPALESKAVNSTVAVRLNAKTPDPALLGVSDNEAQAPTVALSKADSTIAVRPTTAAPDAAPLGDSGNEAPAPCASAVGGEGPVSPSAGLALLADSVLTACCAAVGNSGGALPVEAAKCLAGAVRHVRAAAWEGGAEKAARSARTLEPLAGLRSVLREVFVALCGESAQGDGSKSSPATEADVEAGMWLAAVHFDSAAVHGPGPVDDGDLTDAILRFLTQHGRTALLAAKSADMRELGDAQPGHGNPGAEPLAAALRAVHHALAAAGYAPTPATHRVVPLVVRCLTAHQPMERLQAVAADLLQAILGQADGQLQSLALEQLVSACGKGAGLGGGGKKAPRGRKSSRKMMSSHTSAVLRAICAACVPSGGTSAVGAEAAAAPACEGRDGAAPSLAAACRERAEGRAAAFVDGAVRRCLLGVRERERDPEAWAWCELFLSELLDASTELAWVAAPLVLLLLTKALVRVAAAPRSVDVAWTQREFAVKLLGISAATLARGHVSVREQPSEAAAAEGQPTAAAAESDSPSGGSSRERRSPSGGASKEGRPQELLDLLLASVGMTTAPEQVLIPPCPTARGAHDKKTEAPSLTVAVLPAGHSAYSRSFLMCSWAPSKAGQGQKGAPEKKTRRKGQRADAEGTGADATSEQLLATWAAAELPEPRAKGRGQKGAQASPCVKALYLRALHQDGSGTLARARRIALEALLTHIKSSPFAFVRRQAATGLLAACRADVRLAASCSVAEALANGLHDESACVRVAFIELIDHLLSSASELLTPKAVAECQASVHLRLADASFLVRRAAFRVACKALHAGDPQLAANAADLLRRIQHETQQVRDTVLTAVEHALLAPPLTKVVLDNLVGVAKEPGVDGATVRDLLKAHRAALDPQVYESSMRTIVVDAVKCVSEVLSTGDVTPWTLVLTQIGLEHPAAVHSHIWQLREWLSDTSASPANAGILGLQACRLLSDVLPSWAEQADTSDRTELAGHLQEALAPLLQERGSRLTRAAAECLCAVAVHVSRDAAHALGLYRRSLRQLVVAVESGAALDGEGQRLLGRHAWIVGTVLEFLDVEELQGKADAVVTMPGESVEAAVNTLALLALGGPPALRPSLVPCLGFLLRRYSRFLRTAQTGVGGPLEVFRVGLRADLGTAVGVVMLGQTAESLASLMGTYEEAAQAQAPSSGSESGRDWGATVAECIKLPAVSEAVQRLATLQPEMLRALGASRDPLVARHVVAVLRSLSVLGVLHPSSAMPCLLAASLAGFQAASEFTRRLVLRLLEAAPRLLLARLGAGMREAASRLAVQGVRHGSLLAEKWRFTTLSEAYSERLETRSVRDQFVDVIVEEFEALACVAPASSAGAGSQPGAIVVHQPSGGAPAAMQPTPARVLISAELLVGILAALPYRSELEVAHLMVKTARFLTLRIVPLLAEGGHGASLARTMSLFGACVAATTLKALCSHLAPGAGEVERLVTKGLTEADGGDVEEQQLPASFWRKPPLSVADLLTDLLQAADDEEGLLSLLHRNVPLDSPLLRCVAGAGLGAGSRGTAARGRRGKRAAASAEGGDEGQGRPARKSRRRGAAAGSGQAQESGAQAPPVEE